MKISVYRDQIENSKSKGIRGEIFFSPLVELINSLHVISLPDHNVHNQKWMQKAEKALSPELLEDIRQVGRYTEGWLIVADIALSDDMIDLELWDGIDELNCMTYMQIQKVFKEYNVKINNQQIQRMRRVISQYAKEFFQEEIIFLQAAIQHELKKVARDWREKGIADSLETIHERLEVDERGMTFRKARDYFFPWEEIKILRYTASIFVAPHLSLDYRPGLIGVTKALYSEKGNLEPPKELVNKYHVLGDPTRLKILKLLKNGPDTTQNLAKKLGISEAAVSKQLKLIAGAGFVSKKRESFYQYYYIEREALEFMNYLLFEYL